jgi:hypothetical protein
MSRNDIRSLLLEGLDRARGRLLALDLEVGGSVVNGFVGRVAERSEGVPLYVRFVLGDLLSGKRDVVADPNWLPTKLEGYYEEMLERLTVGTVHQALTPLACTLAVAKEPLTPGVLYELLAARRAVLKGMSGRGTVETALGILETMIKPSPTPEGNEGYVLYHPSLGDHMERSERTRDAVALARACMADAAARWKDRGEAGPYLFRHGLVALIRFGGG